MPKKTKHVQPEYPPEAIAQGIRGIVILDLVVDSTGHVAERHGAARHPRPRRGRARSREAVGVRAREDGRQACQRAHHAGHHLRAAAPADRRATPGVPELRQGVSPKLPAGAAEAGTAAAEVVLESDGRIGSARIVEGDEPWAGALLSGLADVALRPAARGCDALLPRSRRLRPGARGPSPRACCSRPAACSKSDLLASSARIPAPAAPTSTTPRRRPRQPRRTAAAASPPPTAPLRRTRSASARRRATGAARSTVTGRQPRARLVGRPRRSRFGSHRSRTRDTAPGCAGGTGLGARRGSPPVSTPTPATPGATPGARRRRPPAPTPTATARPPRVQPPTALRRHVPGTDRHRPAACRGHHRAAPAAAARERHLGHPRHHAAARRARPDAGPATGGPSARAHGRLRAARRGAVLGQRRGRHHGAVGRRPRPAEEGSRAGGGFVDLQAYACGPRLPRRDVQFDADKASAVVKPQPAPPTAPRARIGGRAGGRSTRRQPTLLRPRSVCRRRCTSDSRRHRSPRPRKSSDGPSGTRSAHGHPARGQPRTPHHNPRGRRSRSRGRRADALRRRGSANGRRAASRPPFVPSPRREMRPCYSAAASAFFFERALASSPRPSPPASTRPSWPRPSSASSFFAAVLSFGLYSKPTSSR